MRRNYWIYGSLCLLLALSVGCKASVSADKRSSQQAQPSKSTIGNVDSKLPLPVVIPSPVELAMTDGRSASGNLQTFNSDELTLSANGQTKSFPITKVERINFEEEVWLQNPGEERRRSWIRGIEITIPNVPMRSLSADMTSNTGVIYLADVLSNREYEKLTDSDTTAYVIRIIRPNRAIQTMTVEIVPTRKES